MQRVTQSMMSSQLLRNLNTNMRQMDKLQNQLSTGRKLNKPSDDPVGITYSMRYRSELSANDQYVKNADAAASWLDFTDTVMDQAGDIFKRVKELTVQGANGTNSEEARQAIKSEIEQLYEQMVTIGNSEFNGRYIFNGQLTDTPPYSIANAAAETTDAAQVSYEVSAGLKMPVSTSGNEVFGSPSDDDNTFKVLKDIISALESNDSSQIAAQLDKLDSRYTKFLEVRADVGARANRLEHAANRLADLDLNLQTLQSKTEDADAAEVITQFMMSENVYRSSLSAGSKLIQPSLVDFLR